MEYKLGDHILCNRQDAFGTVYGTIVKILESHPNYDYIIQIISFSGSPIEDECMWINKDNIIPYTLHTLPDDTSTQYIIPTVERPIKLVYEDRCCIVERNGYDLTLSVKLTLGEVADLLGVDVRDLLSGKVGCWVLDEEKEN
jgi:hypothetical protein